MKVSLVFGLAFLIGHGPGRGFRGLLLGIGFLGGVVLLRHLLRDGEHAYQHRHGDAENRKASSFHTAHRFLGQG